MADDKAPPITGNEPAQRVTNYADSGLQQEIDSNSNKAEQLPGRERPDGEINWMGSSFSGVDIKVVAHLYGALDSSSEEQSIIEELTYQDWLAQSASLLVAALPGVDLFQLGFAAPRDVVLAAAGISNGQVTDPRVLNAINVAYQTTPRVGGLAVFKGALIRKMEQVAANAQTIADNLRLKLERIRNVLKNSSTTIVLATLQTLSLQSHREKFPVRALGNSYCKGYTRGPRTLAGSMIFTMFNEHALAQLIRSMSGKGSIYGERDTEISSLIVDQLPPIDLSIVIANEFGQLSHMGIYGLEFVNDGMTMSVEDILTEEVVQFVARDCDPLTSRGKLSLQREQRGMHYNDEGARDTTATSLLFTGREDYQKFIDKLKVRRRLLNR